MSAAWAHRALRTILGPAVRWSRRQAQWLAVRDELATSHSRVPLPFVAAEHSTPLLRPLLGLDERLQLNKIVNLRIAAARLDGLVLAPGERMSFWWLVGKPSRRKGYRDGLVLSQGHLKAGIGGGLCQLTNLIYWMTLHTPLEVVERWRHSFDVFPDAGRTQPFGSGATCAWPALDLQVRNPTSATYRLAVWVDEERLRGAWTVSEPLWTRYEIEERAHRISHQGPGAYVRHNELWRIEVAGARKSEQLVAVNHALMMYEPFLPEAPVSRARRVET